MCGVSILSRHKPAIIRLTELFFLSMNNGTVQLRGMTCALLLCALLAPMVHAADTAPFADVGPADAHVEALTYLKAKGAIQGYEDGTFQPDRTMNRAEALKMLYVAVGEDIQPVAGDSFVDVPKDAWYSHYVAHAQTQGVVKGYPDGTFRPGNTINKAEALKILLNILREDTSTLPPEEIASYEQGQDLWYAPYLLRSYDLGLTDALNPEDFTLAGDVTRGELAEMLYRILYVRDNNLPAYPVYESGRVSYYSDSLVGNNTSSGEKYDPAVFSAAHRDATLKSFVQVIDNATKKSVLVRVNDRGPQNPAGVADLSSAAFSVFYTSSKGVFDGTVYKLPAIIQAPPKTYVQSSMFDDMPLVQPLPNIFWQDELFLMEVQGTQNLPTLNLTSPSKKVEAIEPVKSGTNSVYRLDFSESGSYVLERPGNVAQRVTFTVLPRFQGKKVGQWTPPAVGFALVKGEVPALTWTASLPSTILRVSLVQGDHQKTLYINAGGLQRAELYGILVAGFDLARPVSVTVDAAATSTRFSHDIYTEWQRLSVLLPDGSKAETPAATVTPAPVPDNTLQPASTTSFSQEQLYVLGRVNEERAKNGAKPLVLDPMLNTMAQFKTDDMIANNYFAHPNLQGEDVNTWKSRFGFAPMVAENIAYSSKGYVDDMDNLIKSPGHYANMIDPRFEIMGVGVATSDGKTYMTQHFSTQPLTATQLSDQSAALQQFVRDKGITEPYDTLVSQVAQQWCDYISVNQMMSFSIDGQDVGSVLRDRAGNASYALAVYGDVGLETLKQDLVSKLQEFPKATGYGFGLGQDKEGMIRLTVVVKK